MTAESDAYEELTRRLVERLSSLRGLTNLRLERNVSLQGKATGHQVDVLWQFIDLVSGREQTVIFECRHYRSAIKQGRLLEFKAVLDDIAAYENEWTLIDAQGVMVTLTAYQIGSRRVAETYGIDVLELREPTDTDMAGRVAEIRGAMVARTPRVENLAVQPADASQVGIESVVGGLNWDFEIEDGDGNRERLLDLLMRGELSGHDEPARQVHRVIRSFDPPVRLFHAGRFVMAITVAAADVGESETETRFSIGGREHIAYLLRDALSGERVWFADDDRIWSTS